jgi:hypothetical protein
MKKRGTHALTLLLNNMRLKSKRSQAGIIVTVLLILLVLAAVVILANVFLPLISESGEEVEGSVSSFGTQVSVDRVELGQPNGLNVYVKRGPGKDDLLNEVKIIVHKTDGSSVSIDKAGIGLGASEIKLVNIADTELGITEITSIEKVEVSPKVGNNYGLIDELVVESAALSSSGLVAWWDFDGVNNLMDKSLNNNDGTLENGALINNNALLLDGVSSYFNVPYDSSLDQVVGTNNVFTISAWIKPKSWPIFNKYGHIGKNSGGCVSGSTNSLWIQETGFKCFMGVGSSSPCNPSGSTVGSDIYKPNLNNWYHLICKADGTDLEMYVDGEKFGNSYPISTITLSRNNIIVPLIIGKRISTITESLDGDVDDVMLYSRDLSADEINLLYNAQKK